jgi:thymidylate synthase (FAD)
MTQPIIKVLTWADGAVKTATAECYGIDPETPGLVERVVKQEHLAVLRHGFASVRISNISRVCGRQILRKAHADYLERSQRYFTITQPKFILPDALKALEQGDGVDQVLYAMVQEHLQHSFDLYEKLRERGILKEDARYIFAQAIETSIVMSGNFQMWWDFFTLRIDRRVQKETCRVAIAIFKEFCHINPIFKKHPKYEYIQ